MTRVLWASIGTAALGLGALGAVLPLLPTTPFVVFAAFAFSNGSPRLAAALHRHQVFGPAIATWRRGGAIAPRHKVIALTMMGGALALSVALAVTTPLLVLQTAAMGAAAVFVLTRPSGSDSV